MATLSSRAESVLKQAMSLTAGEQAEVARRLWGALGQTGDREPVPDWHIEILSERLAVADDDSNSHSAEEVWAELEATIKRVRADK